jgi:hypothetical protein
MTIKVVTNYNPFSDTVAFGEASQIRLYNNGIFNYVSKVYVHDGSYFKMSYPDFPKISVEPYYSSGATYFSGVYKAYIGSPVTVSATWTAGENYDYTSNTYDYQWQKYTYIPGPNIYYWANLSGNGATTDTYTPQEEASIRCSVTATNQRGSTTVYSPSLITQLQSATAPTSVTASNNGSQTTVTVSWSGAANAGRYRIYWNINGTVPGSADTYWDEEKIVNGSTITSTGGSWAWGPSDPDKNGNVPAGRGPQYFMVSASSDGTTWTPYVVTSVATGVVVPAPVNTSQPTLTGTLAVDGTITAKPGSWSNSPTSYTVYIYRGTQNVATSETFVKSGTVYSETSGVSYTIPLSDYTNAQTNNRYYYRAFASATNGTDSGIVAGQELGPLPAPQTAPSGGSVSVSPSSGTAGSTTFTASISGWTGNPSTFTATYSWQYLNTSLQWVQFATGSTAVAPNVTAYAWQVIATVSNGVSPNGVASSSFSVSAPVSKLSTPTGVNASDTRTDGVLVSWNAVSGAAYYGIWWGGAPGYDNAPDFGGPNNAGGWNGLGTSFLDTGISAGSSRDYYVQAYASGNPAGTKSDWGGPNNGTRASAPTTPAPVLSSISGNNSLSLGGTFSWSYTNSPTAYSILCQGPTGTVFTTNNAYTYSGTTFRPGYDGSGWQGAGNYTLYVSATNSGGNSVVSSQTTYMN